MYDDIGPTLPCSKAILIHFLRRHSLIFDIIIFDSIMPSSLPSPSFFHFHRPPSYVVFLSSLDRPIGPTTSTSYPGLSLRFRPLSLSPILSFSFPASELRTSVVAFAFVRPPILCRCVLQCPHCLCPIHQCRSYHIPIDLHVHFSVAHHNSNFKNFKLPALNYMFTR